jgi:hypothetical protein
VTADDNQPVRLAEGRVARPTSHLTTVRRGAVAALLLGWLVVLWISFETPDLHTCVDQIARVGNSALVRSCQPLSITDAPALALLIAAGLLLLPDLSAFEIFGLFRLERQIQEQARRQGDILAAIHKLEVSQRVEVYNQVGATAARVGELAVLQDEKRESFESDAT